MASKQLLIKPNVKWFEHESLAIQKESETSTLPIEEAKRLQSKAVKLLENDTEAYTKRQESRNKTTDFHWINTVLKSGTLSDRMAAVIVLIQDSPVHNLSHLDNLVSMVNVKAKQECLKAMDTLRDLFISDLLPENRKLKTFTEHPLHKLNDVLGGNKDAIDKHIVLWHFEHRLQRCYGQFIMALNEVSRDSEEKTKSKAVAIMYQMLVSSREREEVLLPTLVNKLGDPQHAVAARSADKLNQLVERCPDRKTVIVLEVERLLFRPNVGDRAQYYSICFLNQVLLSNEESELAARLISIYFAFFKAKVKKNEVDTKMMSALLTGVNRAYPYAKKDDVKIQEHINTMYKVVHTVSFNVSVQALMLIHRVLASQQSLTDRYYSALYRKLLSPELQTSSRWHALFLNLVFQSLKNDSIKSRIQAFIKRLLQICFTLSPPVISSILLLISGIITLKPEVLLLKQKLPVSILLDNDDEEEHFKDVDDEKTSCETDVKEEKPKIKSSWHHQLNVPGGQQAQLRKRGYDPYYRNPSYCGAEHSFACELTVLSRHYHPTVALFAQKLLANDTIRYNGDPLQDFTLSRFLDRFVYRNPKKQVVSENMETRMSVLGRRKLYVPSKAKRIAVESKAFVDRNESKVPVDEMYLFRYFSQRESKSKDDDSDLESVNSDEFEAVLAKINPHSKDEVELDFAQDFEKSKIKKKKKKKDDESDSESEMAEESDVSDDFEDDDEFNEAFKDYDELIDESKEVNFDEEADEDEDEEESFSSAKLERKRKLMTTKSSSKKQKTLGKLDPELRNMFAAAEEFGNLIDDNANTTVDTSTLNAMANKDRADAKQLKWELKRDQWVRDSEWKNKKRFRQSKRKSFKKGNGKVKPTALKRNRKKM